MARIKFRDFSGGLHLTAQPDTQPRNSLRRARNIAAPVGGRLRCASPALARKSAVGIAVDGVFRYQDIYFAEGTSAGVHVVKFDNGADVWSTVTLPPIVGSGAAYDPTAATGSQPAVVLVPNSKCTGVLAPTNDGAKEVLFLVDTQNTGPNLLKIVDRSTGQAYRWGILPLTRPEVTGVTTALATQESAFINTTNRDVFQNATDNAAGDGGTGWTLVATDATDADGSTNSSVDTVSTPAVGDLALKVRAGRDDSAQVTHVFASNINLNTFPAASGGSGAASVDEDYIQFFIRIRRPKHIVNVEIAFDTTVAGDFKKDFFSRELTFELVGRRKRRKLLALGDLVPTRNTQQFLKDNADKVKDLTFSQQQGTQRIPVAKNTWTRVTLPKDTFEESGSPDWSTVRAVRVVVHANKQGRTAAFFDLLKVVGGVGMVGDYQYTFTAARDATGTRSNPNISEDGIIAKVSVANVERQGVTLTFPTMTFDPQADRLEVWRTVGNGQAYFKAGEIALTTPGSVTTGTSFTDKTADYIGLHSGAVTYSQAMGATGTWNGNATLLPTELPLDNDSPNDPSFAFEDAVGIHAGRMWWTKNVDTVDIFGNLQDTQGQMYYSPAGRYEAVQAFLQVTAGKSDRMQKAVIWNDRLFVVSDSGLFEIVGTDEPFVVQRVEGAPGTTNPLTVQASQAGIFWVASDGVYRFNGSYATNISDKDMQTVFKWKEAVEDFSASLTFNEGAIGRNAYWLMRLSAAGGGYPVLVFDFETETWRTREATRFLYYDYVAGQMLGAIASGAIHDLEPAPFNTGSSTQTFDVSTPVVRAGTGQKGILRKLFLEVDRSSETITPSIIVDGTTTTLPTIASVTGRQSVEYTLNLPGELFQVNLNVANANNPVEAPGIELDIYVPDEKLPESGLSSDT